jgi:uncharacterized Zn finger protein
MMDDYYQPPEPLSEREWEIDCPTCEKTTWHLEMLWPGRIVELQCYDCGLITESEDDRD